MKKLPIYLATIICLTFICTNANAQLLKKLKEKVNAAAAGNSNNAESQGDGYEIVTYENISKWKSAKDFTSAIANYKFKPERMEFDLPDFSQRTQKADAEYTPNWHTSIFIFEANNTFFDQSPYRGKANSGTYTLTGNTVEVKNNSGGKKFEVLQKGKNYCFKIQTNSGTGYISIKLIPKTDIEKQDASFATNITNTLKSKFNNKDYYIVSGENATSARNSAYSETNYYITNKKLRSTYTEKHNYTPEDIIYTELPVEKIKVSTIMASRNSTSTYLEFELDGTYEIENHIQADNKLTITKTPKVYKAYVGFNAADNAKRLAEIIAKNGTATQQAEYNKIKGGFEKLIASLKAEENAEAKASKAATNAARENLAGIQIYNKKGYEVTIEEIPVANAKGCEYKSYKIKTDKTITFCVGSTIKIKGGETLFTVSKSQDGSTYYIK